MAKEWNGMNEHGRIAASPSEDAPAEDVQLCSDCAEGPCFMDCHAIPSGVTKFAAPATAAQGATLTDEQRERLALTAESLSKSTNKKDRDAANGLCSLLIDACSDADNFGDGRIETDRLRKMIAAPTPVADSGASAQTAFEANVRKLYDANGCSIISVADAFRLGFAAAKPVSEPKGATLTDERVAQIATIVKDVIESLMLWNGQASAGLDVNGLAGLRDEVDALAKRTP